MLITRLSDLIFRPLTSHITCTYPPKQIKLIRSSVLVTGAMKRNWRVKMGLGDQSPPKSTVDVKQFVDFLYEDLSHLFDDQGIDRTAYDERVKFRDPITKYDTISGYLFNIAMLKMIFTPEYYLHWAKPVRKYSPFLVVETDGEKLAGSTDFNTVAGLPDPNQEDLSLRKVEGGIAAVSQISGKPIEDTVSEEEKILRSSLLRDGLIPQTSCLLVRYNDPGRTWSFIMKNEVLVWLEEFSLD